MNPPLEPAAKRCLDKTRSAVLNVLIAVGVGIAASGWILRGRDRGATLWSPRVAQRAALATLLGLVVVSHAWRRWMAARARLHDPSTRATRFAAAHVVAAAIGALAIPLGFVYGYAIQPTLAAVAPYWVAALALGFLALPRGRDLAGFESPLSPNPE